MKTLAIIGGGAAGLAAAIAAGERLRSRNIEAQVVVYEADERVGRSILATGNGRCNFSNAYIDPALYRNAEFVRDTLFALKAGDEERVCTMCSPRAIDPTLNPVHEFFADHGLEWREESEGRLYPLANKASSVLDVLRAAAERCGVHEECGCRVERIEAPRSEGGLFTLITDEGVFLRADAVVLACGGNVARDLLPAEFKWLDTKPVLGPLRTSSATKDQVKELKSLDNVRVRCAVSLLRSGELVACEDGEVLFRSYGVSGIAMFNLSRFARAKDVLSLDLLPQVDAGHEQVYAFKRYDRMVAHLGLPLTCEDFLRGLVLPQVIHAALKRKGLFEDDVCSRSAAADLVRMLKGFELVVEGIGDERQCQVHRGGYAVEAFDERSMEARGVPGLFAAGEALDVDAPCGGYNLHWAWASGILAGRSAVSRMAGDGLDALSAQCFVPKAGERSC